MLKAFAVFDCKAASYGTPMFISNSGLALRGFSDACADPSSAIAKHPGDYSLHEIGSFEPNSGLLKATTPPVHIASAASVVGMMKPEIEQPVLPMGVPANGVKS